jgi:predicted RNase H-like HicB family nuclease
LQIGCSADLEVGTRWPEGQRQTKAPVKRRMGEHRVKFQIEPDREVDGRWIAEISSLPGVLTYGKSKREAIARVKALALRVLADEIEKEKKDRSLDISIACYS